MLGAPTVLVDDITLAVYEALANVVEHAYHLHQTDRLMHLQAQLDDDQLLIAVMDHGCWRTPRETGYRGRGLNMMRSLAEVHLRPTAHGTTVYMRAPLYPSNAGQASTKPNIAS